MHKKRNFEESLADFLDGLEERERSPPELRSERLAEIQEWVQRKRPFENSHHFIAKHIKGLDDFKKIIALSMISPLKPVHSVSIGSPATGKSEVAQSYQEISPNVRFCWGSKLTAAGLSLARLGNEIKIGVLPSCHMGLSIIDELNLVPPADASALLATMAQQWFSVDKAFLKVPYVPSKVSIIGMANPKGDEFLSSSIHQIRRQLPFRSKALLSRFHLIFIVLNPSVEEFDEITKHQLRYRMGRESCTFNEKERGLWRDAVLYLRHIRPRWVRDKEFKRGIISAFTTEAYRQSRKGRLAVPISARLNEGVSNLAEAYARANMRDEVYVRDVMKSVQLIANSLVPCGLDIAEVRRKVAEACK